MLTFDFHSRLGIHILLNQKYRLVFHELGQLSSLHSVFERTRNETNYFDSWMIDTVPLYTQKVQKHRGISEECLPLIRTKFQ